MRKIFAILTALLLVSCSMNHDEVVVAMKATQSTKISKEQALKNLYSELKLIDGATRADGTLREVKSIKPLVGAVTRSGNTLDNDLLYIVEFGEGQGSAVVAADTRLEPVIAVLDTDVLTAEDFANDDMNDISAYMASLIEDYAEGVEKRDALPLIPANPTNIDTLYTVIAPMLKTKWHQQAPYNNLCFDSNGN
ncbi:MAG: Spi family protease inhibitor [Alistipes sp.]|nr:Spi family protease inhibitor [Alistipes sp.]